MNVTSIYRILKQIEQEANQYLKNNNNNEWAKNCTDIF